MSEPQFNARKHGHVMNGVESPTYKSWKAMKRRCGNLQFKSYGYVEIDPKWKSFSSFLEEMGVRPSGTTLDRINNNLGYSKENCRWADRYTQNQNRSIVVLTKETASAVQSLKNSGIPARIVARKFNCSANNIRDIWAGRAWGQIT